MPSRRNLNPDQRAALLAFNARKRRDEARAALDMRAMFHRLAVAPYLVLAEHGNHGTTAIRKDANAVDDELARIETEALSNLREAHKGWFNPRSISVQKNARLWSKAMGIGLEDHSPMVNAAIVERRNASIALVEDAGRDYAQAVREVFSETGIFSVRVEDIKKRLLEAARMPEARARLIARDQTLKLYGGITEAQHKEAGIDRYWWSTSKDERVRPEHAALEGQTFAYNDPPEPGNPGEDFQCRCSAIPIIPTD